MLLEKNDQFLAAYQKMELSDKHLFVTGKAGTGKSTLLDYFRQNTKKNIAVLAPTGVAAVNVRGQTIHSFFGFKPNVTPDTITRKRNSAMYQTLDTIIIDEVSMVRADLLDCIDKFLRIHRGDKYSPFGGVQMIFVGDLYQLPPVVTPADREYLSTKYESPYFFDSLVFSSIAVETLHLDKVYRQKDDLFVRLLNRVRGNTVSALDLAMLNNRHLDDMEYNTADFYIFLTSTNKLADSINQSQLARLAGEVFHCQGHITGDFLPQNTPTHQLLELKVGAQVMLLNNDAQKRWVNGSIGKVLELKQKSGVPDCIVVQLTGGDKVEVAPYTWEQYAYKTDEDTKKVTANSVGSFTQYPLKLAWAVTIHKSQGKTFERVIIDVGYGAFAHGQMYVALSRCTTLKGIVLKQPIKKRDLFVDERVNQYMNYTLASKDD
jgi:ATP-dependent DNA helicase PIF1